MTETTTRRRNTHAGKYHLGGYYDPAEPMVQQFRMLAAVSRRTKQALLAEAIADLNAKYARIDYLARLIYTRVTGAAPGDDWERHATGYRDIAEEALIEASYSETRTP